MNNVDVKTVSRYGLLERAVWGTLDRYKSIDPSLARTLTHAIMHELDAQGLTDTLEIFHRKTVPLSKADLKGAANSINRLVWTASDRLSQSEIESYTRQEDMLRQAAVRAGGSDDDK